MSKSKKLIASGIVLAITIIVLVMVFSKTTNFNKVELTDSNHIMNRSEMVYIDTIVSVGLKVLEIDSVVVLILPMDKDYIKGTVDKDLMLQAFIVEGQKHQYKLFIGNNFRNNTITSVAHELVHLEQYYSETLSISDSSVIYKGKEYKTIPEYMDRPWEIDAFSKGQEIAKEIRHILLK